MLKGFRDFILRGNVIELAVAVVIGAAFNNVVNTIVTAIFNPLISAIFQAETLNDALVLTIFGNNKLMFGMVLGAVINFVIVAAVVYFVFVLPMNKLKALQEARKQAQEAQKAAQETATAQANQDSELALLTEIRDLLAKQQRD